MFWFLIFVFSLIIFWQYLNEKEKRKNEKEKERLLSSPEIKEKKDRAEKFIQSINQSKKKYFCNSLKEDYKKAYRDLFIELDNKKYKSLNEKSINGFLAIYTGLEKFAKKWNDSFVKREIREKAQFFEDIDGKSLDIQQRKAVVIDEDNNLVVAGAGSGKTLTISAKVKYLVDEMGINPEEILLISFTKKAAQEMQERISHKLKIDVKAKTFHKLGLDIISENWGERPDVFDNLSSVIEEFLKKEILGKKVVTMNLVEFFGLYLNVPIDLGKFDKLGEAHEYCKNMEIETIKSKIREKGEERKKDRVTIKGEQVKSIEEAIIANFLFLNGVKYTYERVYPYEAGNKYRKNYRPDFYLDEYDIYLEHFGINKNNKAPWLNEVEEKKYLDGIKWKREVHKNYGTTLLETYSYLNKDGVFLARLDNILRSKGVEYKKVDHREIYKKMFLEQDDRTYSEFKKLLQTFIGLFKSRGFTKKDFKQLNKEASKEKNEFLKNRNKLFLSIVEPIYDRYQNVLKDLGQIDFNDMINKATEIIKKEKIIIPLKYIIIDEYQDISISRFKLVKELKNKSSAKVIAVGDDWQSIYRFAGSDINLFTGFSRYFGFTEQLKLEQTYRNSQELADIAGDFVLKNPKQINKKIVSNKHSSNPVRILGTTEGKAKAVEKAIEEIVCQFGKRAKILILGRNNFDIEELEESYEFKVFNMLDEVRIEYLRYPDLKISFLTAHKSKGLEEDNVIIINLENKLLGFPNKISDDPVLSLVLTDSDPYPFAEERRLFYVAMTRTKNSTYLITPDNRPSIFVQELQKKDEIEYELSSGEKTIQDNPKCTKCQTGYLVKRENSKNGSSFVGCSNYPLCQETFNQVEIIKNDVKCKKCGGYMVVREGKNGKFYGCTNFPKYCRNTMEIWEKPIKGEEKTRKKEKPPNIPRKEKPKKKIYEVDGVKFKMCFAPSATFPRGENNLDNATVDKLFLIGETPVSYFLWYQVRIWAEVHGFVFQNQGREGSHGKIGEKPSERKMEPVTEISWFDCIVWCNALSEYQGDIPFYTNSGRVIKNATQIDHVYVEEEKNKGFRLPSSNEWELAARFIATNQTVRKSEKSYGICRKSFWWLPGNFASGAAKGVMDERATKNVAWFGNNTQKTETVGQKPPGGNGLGLYDMSGNVYELVFTRAGKDHRIKRGGSWKNNFSDNLAVSKAYMYEPFKAENDVGFRLAKNLR